VSSKNISFIFTLIASVTSYFT